MPRLKGSADLLEDRRRRALALLDDGLSLNEVGRRIGCNPSSVMRWRDARRQGGIGALQVRFSPDRKSTRLNSSHLGISYAVFCLKKKKHGKIWHRGIRRLVERGARCPAGHVC